MITISWEILEKHIKSLSPSLLIMGGSRGIRIGFHPIIHSLFLRIPVNQGEKIPPIPYSELSAEIVKDDTGLVLELSTKNQELFPEFHKFAEIIAENYEKPGQTAFGAIEIAIQKLKDLTSLRKFLSKEQQLGLYGELLFLRSLLHVVGPAGVIGWTGRNIEIPDRHDFRFKDIDLEVKTTKRNQRIHMIHGMEQLHPSLGHTLYLLSIKLENAGLENGKSLVEIINDIRSFLDGFAIEKKEFEERLLWTGYKDVDAEFYGEKLTLSNPPVVILVDDTFPKITKEVLESTLSSEKLSRISDVSYWVNVEGLGNIQGSEHYQKIMGEILL